jgi:hypothetical protein
MRRRVRRINLDGLLAAAPALSEGIVAVAEPDFELVEESTWGAARVRFLTLAGNV